MRLIAKHHEPRYDIAREIMAATRATARLRRVGENAVSDGLAAMLADVGDDGADDVRGAVAFKIEE